MNTNGLARHYDKLTPWERLPLILAATARGDAAEADRLAYSAPRHAHRLPDYHGLGEGLMLLTLLHVQTLQEQAIQFWQAVFLLGRADTGAGAAAGAADARPCAEGAARMRAYLFTVEENAWRRLAAELSIDPATLPRLFPPYAKLDATREAARLLAFTEAEATAYARAHGGPGARPETVETALAGLRAVIDSRVDWWHPGGNGR